MVENRKTKRTSNNNNHKTNNNNIDIFEKANVSSKETEVLWDKA